jgi:hypothetical protein
MAEPPKGAGKGEPPKGAGKGDPFDPASSSASCTNDGALNILRSAADLCGLLVVAVVAPLGGGGRSAGCTGPSAQRLALSELRRKAELRERETQFQDGTPGT